MQLSFCPHCFLDTTEGICPRCGFSVAEYETPEKALTPGTIVGGDFKIGRVLGIGGFGITYTGYDKRTGARYAIKEYMPHKIAERRADGSLEVSDSKDKEAYTDGLNMFVEESKILDALTHCPNIVQSFCFIYDNSTGYLIMEFLDGVSLKNILRERGTIDPDYALEALLKTTDALRLVHQRGIIHRDISPENIMVMPDKSIKLIDFGAARFFVGSTRKDESLILKPGFAPPEQYSDEEKQGEFTDIYALAATYYKLVTGKTPPDARTRAVHDSIERLDCECEGVSHHIGLTIHQALSLNYRQRPQNVDEFLDDLLGRPAYSDGSPEPTNAELLQQPTEEIKQQSFFKRMFGEKPEKKEKLVQQEVQPEYVGGGFVGIATTVTPFVRVVSGSINLGQWSIPPDHELSLGRDVNQCDLVINGQSISRKHCTVMYSSSGNYFVLTDYSSNGTFLSDGTRLQPGAAYALDVGSVILLASQNYIMELGVKE